MGCQKTTIVPFEPWHQEQYLCNRSAIISEVIIYHHFLYFIPLDFGFVFVLALLFGAQSAEDRAGRQMLDLFFEQAVIHFKQNRANIGPSLLEKQDRCFDKNVCVNPA
jgi:hypothetical protein